MGHPQNTAEELSGFPGGARRPLQSQADQEHDSSFYVHLSGPQGHQVFG